MARCAAFFFFCGMAAMLAGCASPRLAVPALDDGAALRERDGLAVAAYDVALARRARVYDLAWPILAGEDLLCDDTTLAVGVVLADREQLARLAGGLREIDLEAIGVPPGLRLAHVIEGSPAAAAGLRPGDRVLAIGEAPAEEPGAAVEAIAEELKETGSVSLDIEGASGRITATVDGTPRCDMAVKISTSQELNAHAVTGDIVILTGAIRSLEDPALQFLIAHEAAHLILDHRRKYVRNVGVSGAALAGAVVYPLARLGDFALRRSGQRPDTPLSARSLRWLAPWTQDFEAEADYLGLYLFARAGGDVSAARTLFETLARETPSGIFVRATHPPVPERLARLEAARAEIMAKQARGAPLVPETASRREAR